jgi:hypothetical protein
MCIEPILYTFFTCLFFGIYWNWKSKKEIDALKGKVAVLERENQNLNSEDYKKRAVGDFLVHILGGLGSNGSAARKEPQPMTEEDVDDAANK